jgi:GT2 family glycosyltransferase
MKGHMKEPPEPLVSVIIPTYEREQVLCGTLYSLLEQAYPNYEIVVVDQTQQHLSETKEVLDCLASQGLIRYYKIKMPSLPRARNFGARQSLGEIVLFVDDDVIPSPDLIEAHVAQYKNPSIGGVAGRRTYPKEINIREPPWPVGSIQPDARLITNFSSQKKQPNVQWASGCNMSFRKDVINQVGYFESRYFGTSVYEDVDFCCRLRRLGYNIVFEPQAHLVHINETDGGCGNRRLDFRRRYSIFHNTALFALRNMPLSSWPSIMSRNIFQSLALAKHIRSVYPPLALLLASIHAVFSYLLSMDSLRSNSS